MQRLLEGKIALITGGSSGIGWLRLKSLLTKVLMCLSQGVML